MNIRKISIKNFKSFGNITQTIELSSDIGKLILLVGRNGAGKSSIIDAFDYVLFNKVKKKGSDKGAIKLPSLINRTNKDMEVCINFVADDGTLVDITRGQAPKKLILLENGEPNKRAGAGNIDDIIEKHVGLDIETFKSFISMSINDFKNFISLSAADKKLLLDKLFNLDIINKLNEILNSIISDTQKTLKQCDNDIYQLDLSIDDLEQSIKTTLKKIEDSKSVELSAIETAINELKPKYNDVKAKLDLLIVDYDNSREQINQLKTDIAIINKDIESTNTSLELFNNDKCPTCLGDLDTGFHQGLKQSYLDKLDSLNKAKENLIISGRTISEQVKGMESRIEKGTKVRDDIKNRVATLREKHTYIKESLTVTGADDLNKSLDNLVVRKKEIVDKKEEFTDKKTFQSYVKSILSEDGVRKNIIASIVEPINIFIEENIRLLNLPFEIVLDEAFDCSITSFGEEVDVDTLSTGETKKCNIAIMIAYLKLIRSKNKINVLFLDEVFASVDIESIDDVIKLLRELATYSKMNIFLVHHSQQDNNNFDAVLKVEKDVFSKITTIK